MICEIMTKEKDTKKTDSSESVVERIKEVLEQIRPALQMDGGDVQFVNFDAESGLLKVELMGYCAHCPMSSLTLDQGIQAEITRSVPEVKEVKAIET